MSEMPGWRRVAMSDELELCLCCDQVHSVLDECTADSLSKRVWRLKGEVKHLRDETERLQLENNQLHALQEIWRVARMQPEKFQKDAGEMLVRIAFEAGEISHGRAAELLACSIVDIRERGWVQGPGLEDLLECYAKNWVEDE